jgi:hypothetical protein
MGRYLKNIGVKVLLLSLFVIPAFLGGCAAEKTEGFAIYLTRDDIPPSQMEALSHVEIAASPLISADDVIYYNSQTHELKLTPAAFERISKLDVPTRGRSFLVCVDSYPVYWGAFWVAYSSQSFDGVTIWKPLGGEYPDVITIELGYPSSSFYEGDDPRDNETVLQALEKAGKLITALSLDDIDQLPASFKGYELYSWQESGEWRFTIITGTNRNKTAEEIVSSENIISETGWIKISVVGVVEIKTVLAKLPSGESVFWSAGLMASIGSTEYTMELPPESVVSEIERFAVNLGLELVAH